MAVAPVVPEAGAAAIAAVAFLTFLSLLLLRFGAVTLVGGLLKWLADKLTWIPFVGGLTVSAVNAAVDFVDYELGIAIAATERAGSRFLNYAVQMLKWTVDQVADLASAVEHRLAVLEASLLPAAIRHAAQLARSYAAGLVRRLEHVEQRLQGALTRDIASARAEAAAIGRQLDARAGKLAHAIAVTVPHEIEAAVGAEHEWTRRGLHGLERELARVRRLVTPAALLAAVAAALGRLGLGWLRCSRVNDVGKAVCGMDRAILDSLLLGTTLIASRQSLVKAAEEMQSLIEPIAAETRRFWEA